MRKNNMFVLLPRYRQRLGKCRGPAFTQPLAYLFFGVAPAFTQPLACILFCVSLAVTKSEAHPPPQGGGRQSRLISRALVTVLKVLVYVFPASAENDVPSRDVEARRIPTGQTPLVYTGTNGSHHVSYFGTWQFGVHFAIYVWPGRFDLIFVFMKI